MWERDNPYYVAGNPYNWRTWLRVHLPRPVYWLFGKGEDCEKAGSNHRWYNMDNRMSACYHCKVEMPGQLWTRIPDAVQEGR